jgi:hypothetical protein
MRMTAPVLTERQVAMRCPDCTRVVHVRVPLVDLTDDGAPIFDPTPASTALWLHRRFCTGA